MFVHLYYLFLQWSLKSGQKSTANLSATINSISGKIWPIKSIPKANPSSISLPATDTMLSINQTIFCANSKQCAVQNLENVQYVLHAPDNVLCHTDMHFAIAQISFHLLYIVEIMTYQSMIFIPLTWIACHDNCCHDNTKWPRLWYLSALTFSWLSYRMNINCDNVLHIRIHVLVFKILILLDFTSFMNYF